MTLFNIHVETVTVRVDTFQSGSVNIRPCPSLSNKGGYHFGRLNSFLVKCVAAKNICFGSEGGVHRSAQKVAAAKEPRP